MDRCIDVENFKGTINMEKARLIITAVFLTFAAVYTTAQPLEVPGRIDNVIVYRGQALVTRTIETDLPEGTSEIIVPDLPSEIVSESLFAQSKNNARVISVRYREKSIKEDTREEVKQLEAQIEEIQKRIYVIGRDRHHSGDCWGRYNKLWELTLQAEQQDLNRALLQPEALSGLTEYLEKKSIFWHQENVNLEQQKSQLEKEVGLLNKQLEELKAGRSKKERQAVIYIDSPDKIHSQISLSYLVNNASWLPQYNLYALPDRKKMLVEYNAVIHQASGENWDGVQVNLSTAQPTTEAGAPILDAMKVGLLPGAISKEPSGVPADAMNVQSPLIYDSSGRWRDLTEDFDRLQRQRRDMIIRGKGANTELQQLAMGNQMIELKADKKSLRMIKQQAEAFARNEGVSVAYNLSGKLTMPSRSDQQLVTITSFETDADFVFVATPLLTDYVYLQADSVNNSDTFLLTGPANMYRDGQFAGKGRLDMVPVGKKFTVGFGVESRIQVVRELEDKQIDSWLGNWVENYKYRIAINNYSDRKISLRLMDRMPYTEDEGLGISGFKTNSTLSGSSEYLRSAKAKGILRWDLTLEPETFDDTATVVTYEYTIKYDNDMHLGTVGG
jgi:hypothetical protein